MSGKSSRAGQTWRRRDESVYDNLRQYNLAEFYVDVLVADSSLTPLWRQQPLFDAIVADRKLLIVIVNVNLYHGLARSHAVSEALKRQVVNSERTGFKVTFKDVE